MKESPTQVLRRGRCDLRACFTVVLWGGQAPAPPPMGPSRYFKKRPGAQRAIPV
jgi:hypothetical protein